MLGLDDLGGSRATRRDAMAESLDPVSFKYEASERTLYLP
jgi:hypothetical protein